MANGNYESYLEGFSVANYVGGASALSVSSVGNQSFITVYGYDFHTTGNTTHHCHILQADADDIEGTSSILFQVAGNNNNHEQEMFVRPVKLVEGYSLILYPDTGWTGVTNIVNLYYKSAIPNTSSFRADMLIDPIPIEDL